MENHGYVLGSIPLKNFFHSQEEVREHLPLRLAGGIKLRGPDNMLESRAAIQRNLGMLEERGLVQLSQEKCQALPLGRKRPRQPSRLGTACLAAALQKSPRDPEGQGAAQESHPGADSSEDQQ